jgi:transposase
MSLALTDSEWSSILSFLRTRQDIDVGLEETCRTFLNAVLWILRTGAQWRALPAELGHWDSVYKRWRAWLAKGVISQLLELLAQDADREWLCVDSTVVRAHRCAAGAPASQGGQKAQELGRSQDGFSTKIHVKTDALGNPLRWALTGGHRHDTVGYMLVVDQDESDAKALLADRAYDSDAIRQSLRAQGIQVVIPPKCNRVEPLELDEHLYAQRYVVECFINQIKWFRRVFSRFDKLASVYMAFLTFASCLVWLR